MKVRDKNSGQIHRVILNHANGYEFEGSNTRHDKSLYEILPEEIQDPLNGLTEEEYIDTYGNLP